jgi:hypothetical protein
MVVSKISLVPFQRFVSYNGYTPIKLKQESVFNSNFILDRQGIVKDVKGKYHLVP